MNIAITVTPEQPVPPTHYGGNEKQAAIIAVQLLKRGHAVDLFAGPGTTAPATRVHITSAASMGTEPEYLNEIRRLRDSNFIFDALVDMTANHLVGQEAGYPVVSIMTGDPYKKYPHDTVRNRAYVSKEFARFNGCPDHPILHNIIHADPQSIPIGDGSGGYALYVGAIRPEKGVHIAAQACKLAKVPLKVGGPVLNKKYWGSFKDDVEYVGMVRGNGEERWKLFGDAMVFMYPATFCDAGPLAVMEALLVGTPVISAHGDWHMGGIASDIVPGKNGVLTPCGTNIGDVVHWVKSAAGFNRQAVRDSILPKIDPNKYVDKLLVLCERVARGEEW